MLKNGKYRYGLMVISASVKIRRGFVAAPPSERPHSRPKCAPSCVVEFHAFKFTKVFKCPPQRNTICGTENRKVNIATDILDGNGINRGVTFHIYQKKPYMKDLLKFSARFESSLAGRAIRSFR